MTISESNSESQISQQDAIVALESVVKIITNAVNQHQMQSEVKAIFKDAINQQGDSEDLIKILESDEYSQVNQA